MSVCVPGSPGSPGQGQRRVCPEGRGRSVLSLGLTPVLGSCVRRQMGGTVPLEPPSRPQACRSSRPRSRGPMCTCLASGQRPPLRPSLAQLWASSLLSAESEAPQTHKGPSPTKLTHSCPPKAPVSGEHERPALTHTQSPGSFYGFF